MSLFQKMRINLKNSELELRIKESKHSLQNIKKQFSIHNNKVDRLFKDTMRRISLRLERDVSANYSDILSEFKSALKKILEEDIDYSITIASNQTDEDSQAMLLILPSASPWCNADNYNDTIEKYSGIMDREVKYYLTLGLGAALLIEYMMNPQSFLLSKKQSISAFNKEVSSGRGVSYITIENLKKLGLSSLMLSYNNSLAYIWKKNKIWGYVGYRNSNYPCSICDAQAGIPMPINDMVYPLHNHCICILVYLMMNEVL